VHSRDTWRMEYVSWAPAPSLESIVEDLYYLAGTPPYPRLTVPPMPSALVIINLAAPFRVIIRAGARTSRMGACGQRRPVGRRSSIRGTQGRSAYISSCGGWCRSPAPGAMLDILEDALLARLRPVAGLGLVHDMSTKIS
jgi:hypothetical protein